jgi:hypothetical protein
MSCFLLTVYIIPIMLHLAFGCSKRRRRRITLQLQRNQSQITFFSIAHTSDIRLKTTHEYQPQIAAATASSMYNNNKCEQSRCYAVYSSSMLVNCYTSIVQRWTDDGGNNEIILHAHILSKRWIETETSLPSLLLSCHLSL